MALRDHRLAAARLIVCLALAVVHTWPLALAPGRLSRHDNADTMLNEWIVAWVVHQAPRDPAALFDANIFFPERRTLAFSSTSRCSRSWRPRCSGWVPRRCSPTTCC